MPSERIPRETIAARLAETGYVADRELATALWMMDYLKRPLLIEGEAGVGKTEVAKALALVHGSELIRMQCYEGLDANSALYEWNYQRQLIAIKAREGSGERPELIEALIFSEDYLLERPLLAAIRRKDPPVLLIDEVDRADEEFEAFLLELLSDFQITIPEFGTVKALSIPRVVLTSNGTRELSDASASPLPLPLSRFSRRRPRGGDPAWPVNRASTRRSRFRSRAWSLACARRNCARRRELQRRSTGPRLSRASGSAISPRSRKSSTRRFSHC